jgi:hypothetical protein
MSEFSDTLKGSVNIKRLTHVLLEKSASVAGMALTRQPTEEVRIRVIVEGATISTGSVVFEGSTTDTIAFTANGEKITSKGFTNVSGVTVAGISNGYITMEALDKLGNPVNQEIAVHSALPVRFYALDGKIRMIAAGQVDTAKYKIMIAPDKLVEQNDLMYAISGIQGLTRGQIDFVTEIIDMDGTTHHLEADIIGL